ncbi:MAG: LysR family transcriptional regulator [Pyramidobacter sp.]|nr:LysR family transcriptional regulator [Pyramidobacter sp.]
MIMDFRDLSYVVAIAKHGNITKAADSLFITQPTLTKFLQGLEKNLDQKLFRRIGNRYALTYAGERYVTRATEILNMKKELDDEMSDIVRSNTGSLRIACPAMRSTYMLPCTLPVFSSRWPNVKINLIEASSYLLEDMLVSGQADTAFFNGPVKSPLVDCEVITHEEVVLVLAQEHPLSQCGVSRPDCKFPWMDLKLLKNAEFILQTETQRTWQTVGPLVHSLPFEPKVRLRTSNIQAAVELAAAGYGAYFVTESHLRHMRVRERLACFSVGNPSTPVDFVAAFRKGSYLSHYAQEYINIVRDFT